MYDYAIIGFGPSGMFAATLLPRSANILVLEANMMGGDLLTKYGAVNANINTLQIKNALKLLPGFDAFTHLDKYEYQQCPLLLDCIRDISDYVVPRLPKLDYRQERCESLQQIPEGWTLTTSMGSYDAHCVLLCTGAIPRELGYPIPSIPLEVALHPSVLRTRVHADSKVIVFGTSHSGTLIMKYLYDVGCRHITGVYRGSAPFKYARDGDPEGIKQESATVADAILAGTYGDAIQLRNYQDMGELYASMSSATHIIYAIGFATPEWTFTDLSGVSHALVFDSETSTFANAPNIFGFGIGFPTFYDAPNGNKYPDVGFGPFIKALRAALPYMLKVVREAKTPPSAMHPVPPNTALPVLNN